MMLKKIIFVFILLLCGCSQKQNIVTQHKIETKYFSVEIDDSWKEYTDYFEYDDEYGYSLVFCDKASRDVDYGGHLMSISLYEEEFDLYQLPSFEELGTIEADGILYSLVVEYPTDVQFNEETSKRYHDLVSKCDDVLKTIKHTDNSILNRK